MFSALHLSFWLSLAAVLMVTGGAVRLRGTTLAAPAGWAVGSLAVIALVEMLAAGGRLDADYGSPLRYMAAVTALSPMMALLGAKRPQDRAWQWVVLALLATLWLPAAKTLLLDSGEDMDLFPAWQVFLAVLVLLGPLNYLPTGNWLPSLLVAAGQGVLLAPFFPVLRWSAGEWSLTTAMAAFLAAEAVAWLRARQGGRRQARAADSPSELNDAWLRFRDSFGAFWGVRVMQRVNQGLHSAGSPMELTWHGWTAVSDPKTLTTPSNDLDSTIAQANRIQRTALRRFVRRE